MVEHGFCKPEAGGSNPSGGFLFSKNTNFKSFLLMPTDFLIKLFPKVYSGGVLFSKNTNFNQIHNKIISKNAFKRLLKSLSNLI